MVKQSEITSINLSGEICDYGPVRFLRADWWSVSKQPTIILLVFALNGVPQKYGLRLDMGKQCILDDVDDAAESNYADISAQIRADAKHICQQIVQVMQMRQNTLDIEAGAKAGYVEWAKNNSPELLSNDLDNAEISVQNCWRAIAAAILRISATGNGRIAQRFRAGVS